MSERISSSLLTLTAEIVSAHLSKNAVSAETLPAAIKSVYQALSTACVEEEVAPAAAQEPAVPVKKSVFSDYIVCLEDGKKLKMIKRYLMTHYGMTPAEYRKKWGLPHDYPMVAPNYAATRSRLARKIGLGRKLVAKPEEPTEPEVTRIPARRARGSKG